MKYEDPISNRMLNWMVGMIVFALMASVVVGILNDIFSWGL